MKVEIVNGGYKHVDAVMAAQRLDKQAELKDLTRQYLVKAIQESSECWAGFIDDEIVCLWGINRGTLLADSAHVWLITCHGVEEHPFLFVRHSQKRLDELRKRYHYIHGVVEASNEMSVKWLRWLGFQLSCPEFYNGYLLRKFSMAS